ncbi:MAG: hypothetical protein QM739_07535 [Propionivibrio sp.]
MDLIAMIGDEPDIAQFKSIVNDILALNRRAHEEYQPIVDQLIRNGCRDAFSIERTLDGLLDFCGYGPILTLYRRLCRHYYQIDPTATAAYVYAYYECWESPTTKSE